MLALLEDEMKRPGQALMERSEVSLGGFEFAQGWRDSTQAWCWSERRRPLCVSSSQLWLYRQPQKMQT